MGQLQEGGTGSPMTHAVLGLAKTETIRAFSKSGYLASQAVVRQMHG